MKPHRSSRKFDHEKLEVYQQQLAFVSWVTDLFEDLRDSDGIRLREVCDQLDRASISALLNIAEGNGKRRKRLRARFFEDARGSATECAACLDALVAKRACPKENVGEGKEHLLSVVSMLTRLVDIFDEPNAVHEETVDYLAPGSDGKESEEEEEEEES
jgi:four helix bundle protein